MRPPRREMPGIRNARLRRQPSRAGRCLTGGCSASCTRWCATSRLTWRRSTPRRRSGRPLAAALGGAAGLADLPDELRDEVADELNVRVLDTLASVGDDLVDFAVKPSFRALGRRFGKATPAVAAAIEAADAAWLAAELRSAGSALVLVSGDPVTLEPDDVIVTQTPVSGWAVASEGGETVALEVTITPDLHREGLARETVRLVQHPPHGIGLHLSH